MEQTTKLLCFADFLSTPAQFHTKGHQSIQYMKLETLHYYIFHCLPFHTDKQQHTKTHYISWSLISNTELDDFNVYSIANSRIVVGKQEEKSHITKNLSSSHVATLRRCLKGSSEKIKVEWKLHHGKNCNG
ncbi:hypothetical protein CsSME_00041828 [Camellia sinensis var. sinensis]